MAKRRTKPRGARAVEALRSSLAMRQRTFASILGIHEVTLYHWEHGRHDPPDALMHLLDIPAVLARVKEEDLEARGWKVLLLAALDARRKSKKAPHPSVVLNTLLALVVEGDEVERVARIFGLKEVVE